MVPRWFETWIAGFLQGVAYDTKEMMVVLIRVSCTRRLDVLLCRLAYIIQLRRKKNDIIADESR